MNPFCPTHLNLLPEEDIRLEVLAAALAESDESILERLIVHCAGIFKRGYDKDILQVTFLKTDDSIEKVHIETSREGLYDSLPKGLFHRQSSPKPQPFKGTEQMLAESRQLRAEEQAARQFFLPIEQAFFRQRIRLEQEETSCLGKPDSLGKWFEMLWGDIPALSKRQQNLLFLMLPHANQLAGKPEKLSPVYQAVLGEQVSLRLGKMPVIPAGQSLGLGEAVLGRDWVCGDSFLSEIPEMNIAVGPLSSSAAMCDYLPEGKGYQVIEYLNRFFLPADIEVSVSVIPQVNAPTFELNENRSVARLGWTTIL